MFSQFTTIFGQVWQTYSLAMISGIVLSIAWLLVTAPKGKLAATLDTCLAALVGAIVFGRLLHVALNWAYFGENLNMIVRIHEQGGFAWHGALLGASLAGAIMARFRQVDMRNLLSRLAPILPLIAFAAYFGCATAACAYGASIERMADYPRFLTWLERDIYGLVSPRFATQALGIALAGIVFLIAIVLQWRNCLAGRQVAIVLLLLSLGAFGINFLRGDYALMLWGLRAEQWLDLLMGILGFIFLLSGFPKLARQQRAATTEPQDFSSSSASL